MIETNDDRKRTYTELWTCGEVSFASLLHRFVSSARITRVQSKRMSTRHNKVITEV